MKMKKGRIPTDSGDPVLLEELMEKETTDKDIEEKIEQICRIVAGELKEQEFPKR